MSYKNDRIKELEKELKLLREIDELKNKPKSDIGKWFWGEKRKTNFLYCYQGSKSYGFGWQGNWHDVLCIGDGNYFEATQEEVQTALIKEAEKRGFKEGVRFKSAGSEFTGTFEEFWFSNSDRNCMWSSNCGIIFDNGKWATTIEEPKLEINGHEMKQDGDIISFGCAKFYKDFFRRALSNINALNDCERFGDKDLQNRNIKSITLDSGVEITVEKLKEIVGNIK